MSSVFSEEQKTFIKDNYNKMTYAEIARILNMTDKQVRNKARQMGLRKTRDFNKNYFKEIDTNNKAYWLGFIYADGYIVLRSRNGELGIELDDKDTYILEHFNNELGGVHKINHKTKNKNFNGYNYTTNTSVIRIYSLSICRDLISLNVVPNKTNEICYPKCNKEFFFHFLRGFMDGDGCIYINKSRNLLNVHFTNSNKEFLEYINNEVKDILKIEGKIYKEKDKKYKLYYYRKDDVKILLDEIYKNSEVKLDRKYLKYKSFYGSPL